MIREQLLLFGAAFIMGIAARLLYAILKGLDRWLPMRRWMGALRDVAYGAAVGLALYNLLLYAAGGSFRAYVLLGTLFGWLLAVWFLRGLTALKKRLTRRWE